MEAHVFYLDENAKLQEYIFEDNDKTGYNGSLNDQNIVPANNTRLASYWPSLVYQNPDDTISEMRYDCPIGASSCWKSKNLDIKGPGPSAPLAEVPRGRWGTESHLYYQRQDGELVNLVFRNDTEQWTTGKSTLYLHLLRVSQSPRRTPPTNLSPHFRSLGPPRYPPQSQRWFTPVPRSLPKVRQSRHLFRLEERGRLERPGQRSGSQCSNERNGYRVLGPGELDEQDASVWAGDEPVLLYGDEGEAEGSAVEGARMEGSRVH